MSTLKVIACCDSKGRMERYTQRFPNHNQSVKTRAGYVAMLQRLVELEATQDAGAEVDVLFVVNGEPIPELEAHNGKKTVNGAITVVTRPNVGGSFGAYSFAYQSNYWRSYTHYLFTEDDIFIHGDRYLAKLIEKQRELGADFLALIGVAEGGYPTHAHGGVGIASYECLRRVIATHGCLAYPRGEGWDRDRIIADGEIPFTNEMVRLGLKVLPLGLTDWDRKGPVTPYHDLK
jgi:hypothetical protein